MSGVSLKQSYSVDIKINDYLPRTSNGSLSKS